MEQIHVRLKAGAVVAPALISRVTPPVVIDERRLVTLLAALREQHLSAGGWALVVPTGVQVWRPGEHPVLLGAVDWHSGSPGTIRRGS